MLSAEKDLLLHDMQTWDLARIQDMYESFFNSDQRHAWERCCQYHKYKLTWRASRQYMGIYLPWASAPVTPLIGWRNPNEWNDYVRAIAFDESHYIISANNEEELIVQLGAVVGVVLCL